jgi:tetratricopeptide (TPR) repeat protein
LDRYYHWVAAARMIKENYLVGVGVDSYGDNYRLYRLPEALALRGESNTFANNAHNIYLQLGSTSGLFVLFLYLLLNFYILWRGLHALQKNRGNFSVQIVFVLWIVFQTQSLISIDQLGLAVWGWILSGILVSVSFQNESFDKTLKNDNSKASTMYQKVNFQTKKFTILYLSYILISVLILIPGMQQEYKIFALISKINSTQDQIFLNQELSKLYTVASQAQQPSLRVKAILELFKFQRIDLALELANASTIEFPENVAVWDSVASIYEFKGQFEEAVPARRMTVKLDPLNQNLIDLLDKNLAYLK